MDCREFEEYIPAWLDGTAEVDMVDAMTRHRSSCEECARLLKMHEYVFATLESTEPVAAPPGLTEKILAAAEAEEVAVVVTPIHRRLTLAISAAAFALLGGAMVGLSGYFIHNPRMLGAADTVSANWSYLFEWPLLVKAWFLGLLTRQWMQTLVSPIHVSSLGLDIPVFLVLGYILLLGFLGLFAWNYFRSPVGHGLTVPVRSAHHR